MTLRYRCLVLDHDDTAVDGTATVHYPAHLEVMARMRPGVRPVDLDGWFRKNFDPGILAFLTGELGMTDEELELEYGIWRKYSTTRTPRFYPGFLDVLRAYRAAGGVIAVVSHSESDVIVGHYEAAADPPLIPDAIFGWEIGAERRKPSPWPVLEVQRRFDLAPEDVLVVDDLKPGVIMSQATGVAAAAAGWAHDIAEIEAYMRQHCVAYFETVEQFGEFVLG